MGKKGWTSDSPLTSLKQCRILSFLKKIMTSSFGKSTKFCRIDINPGSFQHCSVARRRNKQKITFKQVELEARGVAALRFFPSTVAQKWLKNETAEKFNKNIGTLRCEEARSWHNKCTFRQTGQNWFLRVQMNIFSFFLKTSNHLDFFGTQLKKTLGNALQIDFYVSRECLWALSGKHFERSLKTSFFAVFRPKFFDWCPKLFPSHIYIYIYIYIYIHRYRN